MGIVPKAPVDSSCKVGGFGTGGAGITGAPNGFLVPVVWVATAVGGCIGFCCEEMGVDCGRLGIDAVAPGDPGL